MSIAWRSYWWYGERGCTMSGPPCIIRIHNDPTNMDQRECPDWTNEAQQLHQNICVSGLVWLTTHLFAASHFPNCRVHTNFGSPTMIITNHTHIHSLQALLKYLLYRYFYHTHVYSFYGDKLSYYYFTNQITVHWYIIISLQSLAASHDVEINTHQKVLLWFILISNEDDKRNNLRIPNFLHNHAFSCRTFVRRQLSRRR